MTEKTTALDTLGPAEISAAKLGTWLFLASEVMLFGSLFSAYVLLRLGAESWAHGWQLLSVPLATLNTVLLISSSITMVLAYAQIRAGRVGKFRAYLLATVLLGTAFLVVKYFEWGHKFGQGHFPRTDLFYATYFTMTGLHVLHVVGGLAVNLYFLFPGLRLHRKEPERFVTRVECAGLYWHFVDLVWIFLFPTLYLL